MWTVARSDQLSLRHAAHRLRDQESTASQPGVEGPKGGPQKTAVGCEGMQRENI